MKFLKKILLALFLIFPVTNSFAANVTEVDTDQSISFSDGSASFANGIAFNPNGTKMFVSFQSDFINEYDLSTPFDIGSATFNAELDLAGIQRAVAFNNEGTKLYELDNATNAPKVNTYSMTTPYDIANATLTDTLDLSETELVTISSTNKQADDIHFNDTGSAMYILMHNEPNRLQSYIWQFSLDKRFDVSTAKIKGKWNVALPGAGGYGFGLPRGFDFSSDGMKLYVTNRQSGAGVDQVYAFQLECPFGLYECVYESESSIGSQIELAKQNIQINTSTVFKRFEWIKRNRDEENLTAHNLNFNYKNTLIDRLANKFEPVARKNIASLISKTKNEDKKSKWSTWSLVDVYVGLYGQHGSEKPKDVLVKGITLGADRKYGDDKFFGLAVRYGDSSSEIKNSKQDVTMESLTLNLYGIAPTQHNQYVNAVLGVSYLSIDHIYQSKLSGERHGGQIFGTLNYRTRSKAGRFNMTPTAKLTYGITHLSEFTDYINNPSDPLIRNLTYKDTDFATGELAAGFLFEMDEYVTDMGTIQPMGGLELLYDLSEDIDYKYIYHGETNVVTDTIRKYSNQDLKYNIGFEAVYLNGFTISSSFEKIISLNDRKDPNRSREIFILKFSRSKEEDGEFAFNYNPVNAHESSLSYSKNINGFDFSINHNQIFENSLKYDTNVEVSSTF